MYANAQKLLRNINNEKQLIIENKVTNATQTLTMIGKCLDVIDLMKQMDHKSPEYALVPSIELQALESILEILNTEQGIFLLSQSESIRNVIVKKIPEWMKSMNSPPFSNLSDVIEVCGLLCQTHMQITIINENIRQSHYQA